jgi:hypothetical protein
MRTGRLSRALLSATLSRMLSGTYDFAWISHPASYGFTIGSNADWHPDRAELVEQIRSFLADSDPKTGYLPD